MKSRFFRCKSPWDYQQTRAVRLVQVQATRVVAALQPKRVEPGFRQNLAGNLLSLRERRSGRFACPLQARIDCVQKFGAAVVSAGVAVQGNIGLDDQSETATAAAATAKVLFRFAAKRLHGDQQERSRRQQRCGENAPRRMSLGGPRAEPPDRI